MPYFVISRPPQPPGPDGSSNQFALLAGSSGEHESRPAAEAQAARLRSAKPDQLHTVVEAESAMDAVLRSQALGDDHLEIETVTTWAQMQEAIRIRWAVFVEEQGVPEEEELDEHDLPRAWRHRATHALGRLGAMRTPVATARVVFDVPPGELPVIGRVAVAPWARRQGHGRAVVLALQGEARRRGFPGTVLHAQTHAIPFYESLGYEVTGAVFIEAGLEHRTMELRWE